MRIFFVTFAEDGDLGVVREVRRFVSGDLHSFPSFSSLVALFVSFDELLSKELLKELVAPSVDSEWNPLDGDVSLESSEGVPL